LTPRRIANVLVNTDEHCVGLVIIVAVLGRSMKEASDAGMALEIDVERRHELRHGEPPFFVDEPSDSRQAIGRVRIAVGLESASQVAYPSREHGLSTGYTVVVQHGEEQERSLTPGDIVFDLLLARHQRDEVFNLLCVGMPQLIEGIEIGKAPNIESDLPTRDRITAIAQRCVQGSEQVDHAAGRTEA